MADFGLYSALSQPRRNWAQVRQDRMMELGMLQNMQQDLKQRVDAESQARAGVVEYMNELQKSSVLEGDYERVKAVEEAERKKIIEGIQNAGNNVQKFLNGDGASILNNYRNNIIQSDEMRNAISNKLAFGQAGLDRYMGRIARPTYDEQGNRISFDQQVEQFQNGERERLEYNGSVQPVDITKIRSIIQSTYGEDRYKRQAAGADDIYNIAIELGAEDWMAEDIRDGYMAGVDAGAEPLRWKWDEAPKTDATLSQKRLMELMAGRPDLLKSYLQGALVTPQNIRPKIYNRGTDNERQVMLESSPIDASVMSKLMNLANVRQGKEGELFVLGTGKDFKTGKQLDLSNSSFTEADIIDYVIERDEGSSQGYLRVKIDMPQREERRQGRKEGDDWWLLKKNQQEVLIPVDNSAWSLGAERFAKTDEERYGEENMDDMMYLYNAINSLNAE